MAVAIEGPIVRYVDQTTASVWVEFGRRQAAMLTLVDITESSANQETAGHQHVVQTVQVGGHHYALPYVTDLKPGRWYRYCLEYVDTSDLKSRSRPKTPDQLRRHEDRTVSRFSKLALRKNQGPILRTLAPIADKESFRIAFGSCYKWADGARGPQEYDPQQIDSDALTLFADWMNERPIKLWPYLLILMGDQIYADDVSPIIQPDLRRRRRQLATEGNGIEVPTSLSTTQTSSDPAGSKGFHLLDFHEFSWLHRIQWRDHKIRQVLANIATFMIVDDHDITDDWNLTGGWVEQMTATPGWTEVIVDGLVAYWVYQAWGNLDPTGHDNDDRIQIMRKFADFGADALEPFRELMYKQLDVELEDRLRWYYRIPSSPPIFVMDTRNDRVLKPPTRDAANKVTRYASNEDRIVSKRQLDELVADLKRIDEPAIVVSPVTILNPFPLDLLMVLGARPSEVDAAELKQGIPPPWVKLFGGLERSNPPELFEDFRRMYDTDYWSAFPKSFTDLVESLYALRDSSKNERSLITLSGDVHFSYAMTLWLPEVSRRTGKPKLPSLIQLVSSPILNAMNKEKQKGVLDLFGGDPDGGSEGLLSAIRSIPLFSDEILATVEAALEPLDPLLQLLARVWEHAGSTQGLGGSAGPEFTISTRAAKRAGRLAEGILFGNSIATLDIDKRREHLAAIWWNTGPKDKKLLKAATRIERLAP